MTTVALQQDTLTQSKKVDMIFSFLFGDKKAIEEEAFWNGLHDDEIQELQKIRKEKTYDFSKLKKKSL